MGDLYLQFDEHNLPEIRTEGKKTVVTVKDILSAGKEMEMEVDLVVLVTGMVPRADQSIGTMLKLPKGRDRFFNEIHMKLRPVETVIDGVTIAGTCQGPKNISESVNSALSAATKSFSYISKGTLETEPIIAEIDQNLLLVRQMQQCLSLRCYRTDRNGWKKGCIRQPDGVQGLWHVCSRLSGRCHQLIGYTSEEMMSMIDALA